MRTFAPRALAAALVVALTVPALATGPDPVSGPAGLAKLKSLAGTWTGANDQGPYTVEYEVVGNGSAVVERLFPGTPHSMVTVYHLDGDALVATHYCSIGNQPHLRLDGAASDGNSLVFGYTGGTNIRPDVPHIAGARFVFTDADHFTTDWASMKGDEAEGTMHFDLTRK